MIDLSLIIVIDGEKHTVDDVRPVDFVALERHMKISIPQMRGEINFDQMCFLCWRVLRRRGVAVGEYDEFLERIDMIEPEATPFAPVDTPSSEP